MTDPRIVNDPVSPSDELAERSAEERALSEYALFLLRRYERLARMEATGDIEAAEPDSWPQVFVPMRLGAEDLAEESCGNPQNPAEEELPGTDAWEVLGSNDWVMLAGRRGSGRKTLVRTVILELCSEKPSALRAKLRALPVPLIFRDLGKLTKVKTLTDLFELFWEKVLHQAAVDGFKLDRARLEKTLLNPDTSERSTLLIFHGIHEIGSNKLRQQLFKIARRAWNAGCRVLLTGSPDDFREHRKPSYVKPLFLLPFAWPQIQLFMEQCYRHRDEWEARRADGLPRFLAQISHPDRRDLLMLARRPNLLALLAMVHCSENGPLGRTAHYGKLVDYYLERQRRHRRLQLQLKGEPFEDWPDQEVRLTLAYLALRSQHYRTQAGQAWEATTLRRIAARHEQIHDQLELRKDFFYHPAGLLVNGALRWFVTLRLQEYLCAYFLHEQGKLEGEAYLQEELWSQLGRPGWQEVGLFFLAIHADATKNEGHFRLLTGFDLNDVEQATLYGAALTDQELPFRHEERLERLPVALAAALVHPSRGIGLTLGRFEAWRQECRVFVLDLFKAPELEEVWAKLPSAERQIEELRPRWLEPQNDLTWNVLWSAEEARTHSLLELASQVGFWTRDDIRNPIADAEFEAVLAEWLQRRLAKEGSRLFWQPVQYAELPAEVPETTPASWTFDRLVPCEGPVFAAMAANLPAEVLVLQGETADPEARYWDLFSQPSVLAIFQAKGRIPPRARFALSLYECVLRAEFAASDGEFYAQDTLRSRSLARSRSLTRARSLSRSRSLLLSQSLARSQALSRPRTVARSRSMSRSLPRSRALVSSLPFGEALQKQIKSMIDLAEKLEIGIPEAAASVLTAAGFRFAARDYFEEKRENPPGPVERQVYVELGRSLETFEAFFREVFGNEQVGPEVKAMLEEDWNTLAPRPWSPQAMVAALMKDWPEAESVRDVSWEATQTWVTEAVAVAMAELEAEAQAKEKQPPRDRF